MIADFAQDMRYALRQARRSPAFFGMAAMLIALGIAAATQIFTLVDALLLRPLPVRDPASLVQLFEHQAKRPTDPLFDYAFYRQVSQYSATLFDVAGEADVTRAMEINGHAERVHTIAVTENFFAALGVVPHLGRLLGIGDSHVAVLSYSCWSRSFGRDPKVLGRMLRLQGHAYTVAGVAPEEFTGTMVDSSPDLWVPMANQVEFSQSPSAGLDHYVVEIVSRLRPGVTLSQARQETAGLWGRYLKGETGNNLSLNRGSLEVHSIAHGVSPLRDQSSAALLLLLVGTGLLLLMVCANVGGLLLSKAAARERETAVRVALGAGRAETLRQWLAESLLLASVGGCAGLLMAYAGMPWLMRAMPPAHGIGFDPTEARTLTLHTSLDIRVAAFSVALCALTGLLCALAPAWRSYRTEINSALKTAGGDRKNRFSQSALCIVQIALCTTLLVSAGLIVRSLSKLRASDAGFDAARVTVFSIDPHVRSYDSQKTWLLQQRILSGVREIPGVQEAALADQGLMRGIGLGSSVVFPGERGGVINSSVNSVNPEYFAVMGIPFLSGRGFESTDMADADVAKVVVNEAFVRKFLGGRDPLGRTFGTGRQFVKPQYEIVGVVADSKYRSLREVPPPIFYTLGFGPKAYPDRFILHVRSRADPRAIIEPVRQIVRSLDSELPLYQVATLSEEVDRSLWRERLLASLSSCFGVFALSLSAVGLYAVLAQFVARRRREIGLRMALGAEWRDVLRLLAGRVIPVLGFGVLAGGALSWVASVWVRNVLYGVDTFDVVTIGGVLFILAAMGVTGAAVPSIRAMRVDPGSALRQD